MNDDRGNDPIDEIHECREPSPAKFGEGLRACFDVVRAGDPTFAVEPVERHASVSVAEVGA